MARRHRAATKPRPSVERMIKRLKRDLGDPRLTKRGNDSFQACLGKTPCAFHVPLRIWPGGADLKNSLKLASCVLIFWFPPDFSNLDGRSPRRGPSGQIGSPRMGGRDRVFGRESRSGTFARRLNNNRCRPPWNCKRPIAPD